MGEAGSGLDPASGVKSPGQADDTSQVRAARQIADRGLSVVGENVDQASCTRAQPAPREASPASRATVTGLGGSLNRP